ncbi:MAG: hypothetical protein FWG49_03110 [Leptospirales bacterium]|nr:hypothetical protein [Leptospirales bacterium]
MNINKKILILIGIVFSVIILSIAIMKISLSVLYPENLLTNFLKVGFKDLFGKAIKFDTAYIKFNGNIAVKNFYLSNSDDFNDNINLVKCDEIIIHTSFPDLIRKKITFTGISMIEPNITINKNYGRTYADVFIDDIVSAPNKEKLNEYIADSFRFELLGSTLSFTEVFKNSKSVLDFYNLDLKFWYNGEYITYKSKGNIHDKVREGWFKCSYSSKGKIYLDKNDYEAQFEVKNFDLNYLTGMLNDNFTNKVQIFGVFDGKFHIASNDDINTCNGKINISSLDISYYLQDDQYPLFKKEKIKSEFKVHFSNEWDKFTIDRFEIDNGAIQLSSTFDYSKDNLLSMKVNSNNIDLDKLSESVHLFRNCKYNGEANINGRCVYSLKDKKAEDIELKLSIENFNIMPLNENSHDMSNVIDGYLLLKADKEKISLRSKFISDISDIDITYSGQILKWQPIKSSNKIEIYSKNLQLNFLSEIVLSGIRKIYSMAYIDLLRNFDEQRDFLTEPEGIFINNNDITFKLQADQLYVAGESYLNNFDMDISLIKGTLKTNRFSAYGYNGIYRLDLYSYLRQSYPFFRMRGVFSGIDLGAISADSKLDYSFGGNLSVNISFEADAYRVGQIVENARAGIDISIRDGYINNIPFQKKLNEFFNQNGYQDRLNRSVDFKNFSLNFVQSANNYFIRNFSLQSAGIYFGAYGSYSVEHGLNIPVTLSIPQQDKKIDKIPLEIVGNLEAPCINVKAAKGKDKKEQSLPPEPLCF